MSLSRPSPQRLLLAALCLVLGVGLLLRGAEPGAAQQEPPPPERPNFLHILTDDQTIDSLQFMKRTQRLVGREGTAFTNHHAVQPLCCPSRASFLSGQYPHNHGVLENLPPYGYPAMDFEHTIYTSLDGAGYRTGWIGKVLNTGSGDEGFGVEPAPGFDEWFVPLEASELDMFDFTLSDNGTKRSFEGAFQSDVFAARAREFLAAPGEEPFMLTLALTNPHWSSCDRAVRQECPPDPAPRDLGTFRKAKFPFPPEFTKDRQRRSIANHFWRRELESLQSVDRIVGSLVAQLRESGELDDTYVIFQSDNGLLHGEHGVFDKNVPWDRSVRVPLLIRGPGVEAGAERDDLTANVDVPATIAEAAGVAPPLPPDGYSLLGEHRRRYLLLERLLGMTNRAHRDPWRQLKSASGWTYWRNLDNGTEHLYDLRTDPFQTRNVAGVRPLIRNRMAKRMRQAADCANPCP